MVLLCSYFNASQYIPKGVIRASRYTDMSIPQLRKRQSLCQHYFKLSYNVKPKAAFCKIEPCNLKIHAVQITAVKFPYQN